MGFLKAMFPVSAQAEYERAEAERKRTAKLIADAEFHRIMANFYTERVASLDPHTQWWEFAEAKQKQYDQQLECVLLERRAGFADTDEPVSE